MTDPENKLRILSSLPVFPAVADAIIDSFNDPFVTAQQIVAVVGNDPAIAARLVGLANSAYFSQQQSVGDLETAVIRVLGLDLTRGVALGMALNNVTSSIECPAFDSHSFWRDSLGVALVSQALARRSDRLTDEQQSLPYIAGLLARIGLLALLMNAQTQMQSVLENDETALAAKLIQQDLPTHLQAAAWLSEQWGLPQALSVALKNRHNKDESPDQALADILQCAVLSNEILTGKQQPEETIEQLHSLLENNDCREYIETLFEQPALLQDAISQSIAAIS